MSHHTPDDTRDGLVKIAINIEGHWTRTEVETMWAAPTDDGLYELRNTPFYAYGLNWGDIVAARDFDDGAGERLWFTDTIRRSGHRTIRIIFVTKGSAERDEILSTLNTMCVSYEGGDAGLFALDLSPEADFDAVSRTLSGWQQDNLLGWELGSDGS